MEDVAARAGVSRALVSIVFRDVPGASDATREKVRRAASDIGYVPDSRASRLGRSRTRMIGVVFALDGDFHAEVIDGLYDAAGADGYEIVLSAVTARRPETRAVRALLAERCEGVVLVGPRLRAGDVAELAKQIPTVVMLRPMRLKTIDVVRTDERRGMSLVVGHLAELGHRRILHIDGGRAVAAADRRAAYRRAAETHGLSVDLLPGGQTEESGVEAGGRLLQRGYVDRPTAVAAFNDRCALGLMHRLAQARVDVPRDVSVAGFDGIAAGAASHVRLTTIRQDTDTLGRMAIERLRARLDGGDPPQPPCLVPPELVVRHTTAVADGERQHGGVTVEHLSRKGRMG